ncbi:MAG TPA: pyridoxamine 5'-phosphate oxidase [Acidimicrobiales bacterium]
MAEHSEPLDEADVDPDPFAQFGRWFEEAGAEVRMPEAVALATVDDHGRPSLRMVLMKGWDRRGFVFHTNYESRKGRELAENRFAALLFYWDPFGRQVRIEGTVEKLSAEESDAYFNSRPLGAQIGAHASRQSETASSRACLDLRVQELTKEFEGQAVPRPAWWGGYRLAPDSFEFWQNRDDRLHDRLRYLPVGSGWQIDRLQP